MSDNLDALAKVIFEALEAQADSSEMNSIYLDDRSKKGRLNVVLVDGLLDVESLAAYISRKEAQEAVPSAAMTESSFQHMLNAIPEDCMPTGDVIKAWRRIFKVTDKIPITTYYGEKLAKSELVNKSDLKMNSQKLIEILQQFPPDAEVRTPDSELIYVKVETSSEPIDLDDHQVFDVPFNVHKDGNTVVFIGSREYAQENELTINQKQVLSAEVSGEEGAVPKVTLELALDDKTLAFLQRIRGQQK